MPVTAQPRNSAWDMLGLPAGALGGLQDRVPGRSTLHQISMLGGVHIPWEAPPPTTTTRQGTTW
jgi:hypothetical protein